jgi:hypothetical protein
MLNYTDIFDLLGNSEEQPVAAVYMTYGFDAQLFESHVLPAFLGIHSGADDFDLQAQTKNSMYFRYQVALKLREVPVAVYSDGSQYAGGRSFLYDHITIYGSTFHPKCYVLLFKDYLRVIISSSNLTTSGLCYNAEVLWYEDIYLEKESSIAGALSDVLIEVAGISNQSLPDAVKEICRFLARVPKKTGYPKIVSTCDVESPLMQFHMSVKGDKRLPKEVTILSPFYENDREKEFEQSMAITFLSFFSSNIRINLYFPATYQNNKWVVSAPKHLFYELTRIYHNVHFYVVPEMWEREDGEPVLRSLHGKIVCVRFSDKAFLCMGGSINFTERAMRSKKDKLRNIEIGILELTRKPFLLPECTQVGLDGMEFREEAPPVPKLVCFVRSAILEHGALNIQIDVKKAICPFKIIYDSQKLTTILKPIEQRIFANFKLGRNIDLEIYADGTTFFVPITVLNKAEIVTEDLDWDFTLGFGDIVDYLAGKYRSVSELYRAIKALPEARNSDSSLSALYFRQNLQRYFKAIKALKQGLEQAFYTEYAFKGYLSGPVGLNKLAEMILESYKTETAEKQETFLYIAELFNVLLHLDFKDDWVDPAFKLDELHKIADLLYIALKTIVKNARGVVRKQHRAICDVYGIEVK